MRPVWGDLIARARGLGTRLLPRGALDQLARQPDLVALADALRRNGYPMGEEVGSAADLELAVRRVAAAQLAVLARWCGTRTDLLAVVFEDEDRRTVRALVRGAAAGASPEERIAGLVPTPALPERALAELSRQQSPGAVAALLAAWRSPYGEALLPEARATQPDLLKLEVRVNRAFAARALRAARRAGRRGILLAYVRETIDLENVATAVGIATEPRDVTPKDLFLPGGHQVSISVFEEAAAAGDGVAATRRLAAACGETPIARALARTLDPGALERELLQGRIAQLRGAARRAPLGPAPILLYSLRLRAQVVDLHRIIWGVALGAPSPALAAALVTD